MLHLVSKIIENVIHDQTQSFLNKIDITHRYQSGSTKFFSTDSWPDFESGLYTDMILIDLQKASDTVNRDILLKKMEFIGFSEEKKNGLNLSVKYEIQS